MTRREFRIVGLATLFVFYFGFMSALVYLRAIGEKTDKVRTERVEVERAIRLIRDQRAEIEAMRKSLEEIGR